MDLRTLSKSSEIARSIPVQDINEFRKGLGFVLKWEGDYSIDPDDPGGETKWGISKRAYPSLDIKNLTPEQACTIYANDYWDKCGCDDIPYPLNIVVFDSAVQHGPSKALEWLKSSTDVDSYIEARKQYYIKIVNKNPPSVRFLRGWLNRLGDLDKFVTINTPEET
jgi:hypothetical protein